MKQKTRKEQILKIAAKLFKEKGYSAVSMRDLAAAMGIKAASLYNHIDSKQDILKHIIISLAEEFTTGMQGIMDQQAHSLEKLQQIISLHIRITTQYTDGMAALNNDWMHLEEQLDYYLSLRSNYEEDFRNIIKEGIENNEITDANPDIIMFSILSTLRSLYLWIPKKEEQQTESLSAHLSRILINGINK